MLDATDCCDIGLLAASDLDDSHKRLVSLFQKETINRNKA
jgi:hypothetical protein